MEFERSGYTVVERVVSDSLCKDLIEALPPIVSSGSRLFLWLAPFLDLVPVLRSNENLAPYLRGLVAVECIHFRKSLERNWAVRLHRDSVLPVKGEGEWRSAGIKAGGIS